MSNGQGQGTPRRNNAGGGGGGGGGNNSKQAAKRAGAQPKPPAEPTPAEFWRIPPKVAAPTRIAPATDPTALVRSLGRPPLDHAGADRYLASVAQRAAGLATALAVAADILAKTADD